MYILLVAAVVTRAVPDVAVTLAAVAAVPVAVQFVTYNSVSAGGTLLLRGVAKG